MKESISYAFILNIMITFVFICFAVIMGIFSYYRAFRANTAILNSLEKYEGYNCLSIAEIDRMLKQIGYKTPFAANQKSDGIGEVLTNTISILDYGYMVGSSENLQAKLPEIEKHGNNGLYDYGKIGYSVIYYSYNYDNNLKTRVNINNQNVDEQYQFGTFTYMYLDIPIINFLFKVPVYGKTNVIQEFRDIVEYSEEEKNAYLSVGKRKAAMEQKMQEDEEIRSKMTYGKITYDRRMLLKEGNISLADFGLAPSDELYYKCTYADQLMILKGTADFECDAEGYKVDIDTHEKISAYVNRGQNDVSTNILELAARLGTSQDYVIEARIMYKGDINGDGLVNAKDATLSLQGKGNIAVPKPCGTFINYKIYGGVIE